MFYGIFNWLYFMEKDSWKLFSHFSSNLTERSQDMLFTILSIKIIQMVKYGSFKMLIQEIRMIISPAQVPQIFN